jgi:NAD(P)-dependent dehydrogenase (short-subunit alcohol dehydrogenase family)
MKLTDKHALVIGAASGLGAASAKALAEEGAHVVVADVDDAGGTAVVEAIEAAGGKAVFRHTDATDRDSIRAAVDFTADELGSIDILVNSAGKWHFDAPDAWDRHIEIFLHAVWCACMAAIEKFQAQGGGVIVNISSIAGVTGSTGPIGYGAAKHGVIGLSKSLVLTHAKDNIRINVVCPGYIKSGATEFLYNDPEASRKLIHDELKVPMDRWGEPHEIGRPVAFLASDDASFITGQTLIVDGGFMAR